MSFPRRQLSVETIVLLAIGAVFLGLGVVICVTAYRAGTTQVAVAPTIIVPPALPPALPMGSRDDDSSGPAIFAPAPAPTSIFGPPPDLDYPQVLPQVVRAPPAPAPAAPARQNIYAREAPMERQTSPSIVLGGPSTGSGSSTPLPPSRPIGLNVAALPPSVATMARHEAADASGAKPASLNQYDHFTAVYDLTAHVVYLPDGGRLEAHSGLGSLKDDPSHVDERDRGATPPHLYDLTMREGIFHGVQALRLNPVGGPSAIFGRAGLLAHTYMLGPDGDSNGCVSFKNYDAFLQAFQSGLVKRLAVVSSLR